MLSVFDIIKKKINKIPEVFQDTQMEISGPRTQKYLQLKKTILVYNLLFPEEKHLRSIYSSKRNFQGAF